MFYFLFIYFSPTVFICNFIYEMMFSCHLPMPVIFNLLNNKEIKIVGENPILADEFDATFSL